MPKKVVISGYYGFDNFGDDAILSVLCDKLKSLNSDITVISANPSKTSGDYGVKAVKNFDIKSVLRAISASDILVSGGGSLLQDVTSLKSLLYYSFVISCALFFEKDVIVFAQGIGPLKRKISQKIVKSVLSRVRYVSVRDKKSYELLQSWGINAVQVNDPVYNIKISDVPKNFAVGIQLRAFSSVNEKFLNELADNILKHFSNRKIELFVFQEALDKEICLHFENILKNKCPDVDTKVIYYKNRTETFKRIAQLDCMIAMRFHAVIAALKAGVKTAGINYDIKVEKLAEEASIPLISLESDNNSYDELFYKLKSLNSSKLKDFASSKHLDWSGIEKLFITSH